MAGTNDIIGIAAAIAKSVPGTAGAAAVAAKEAAEAAADEAQEILESIPEDYSELSADVGDLKNAVTILNGAPVYYPLSWKNGYYIDFTQQGVEKTDSGWCDTDYIEIGNVTRLYHTSEMSAINSRFNCFYDANKNYVGYFNTSNQYTDIPTGAVYFRLSRDKTKAVTISPEIETVKDLDGRVTDIEETLEEYPYSVTKSPAIVTKNNGAFVSAVNHNIVSNENYFYTDPFALEKGDSVIVTSSDSSGSNVARISRWDSTGTTFIEVIEVGTTAVTTVTYTATLPIEYLVFSGQISVDMTIMHVEREPDETFENAASAVADNEIEKVLTPSYTSISLFDNMGVCGDSYTAAQFYNGNGLIGDNQIISWGKILGRDNGIDVTVYASSGADTHTWQERSSCLTALLNDQAKRLYIFALGINDYTYVTKGTIDDIHEDYTDNPNTFYGNWGSIIDQVKAHAPNARIVLMKCWLVDSVYYNYGATAIEEICAHYNIPYIDPADNPYFASYLWKNGKVGAHPTPIQQSSMAKAVKLLMERCMQDNPAYFNDYFPQ